MFCMLIELFKGQKVKKMAIFLQKTGKPVVNQFLKLIYCKGIPILAAFTILIAR
jgi:hypothetical protein